MFGIIAGVLIGVWAMYTMLSEDAGTKRSVAEVWMIKEATRAYKAANGNSYNGIGTGKGITPYLGQSPLSQADARGILTNHIGSPALLFPSQSAPGHAHLVYSGLLSYQACTQVLKSFGEVDELSHDCGGTPIQYIPAGQTFSGFIGGNDEWGSGCTCDSRGQASLILIIE